MTCTEPVEDFEGAAGKTVDVAKLLAKCEELVGRFQYDLAIKFCERILEHEPQQLDALQMKATILIDAGETDQAKEVLLTAVSAQPDSGAGKYLALAQLCEGQEALQYFLRTLEILNGGNGEETEEARQEMITSVYCSLAELYMTDLCETADAEACCEKYVQAALATSPHSYEAFQTLANMRLSQDRTEEAAEALAKSIQLWTLIPFESVEYPTYEFRLTCARLLVEMGSMELAREILTVLSQEDEEILEVWYLLSLCLFSEQSFLASHEALQNAERLATTGADCPELADAMAELREALGAVEQIKALPQEEGEEGQNNDEEEEEEGEEYYDDEEAEGEYNSTSEEDPSDDEDEGASPMKEAPKDLCDMQVDKDHDRAQL